MFESQGDLIWKEVFVFSEAKSKEGNTMRAASVVWKRFAWTTRRVHAIGFARRNAKLQAKLGSMLEYRGFLTARVGAVRNVETRTGKGLKVVHEPSQGI